MMMSNIITAERFLTIRCRAFTREGVRSNLVHVAADVVTGSEVARGAISVWDVVAGHYTTCHTLSDAAQMRIRRTFQPN